MSSGNDPSTTPPPPTKATPGRGLIIGGAVVTVVGIASMLLFGRAAPGENSGTESGFWQAGVTWGASIVIGVGVLLLLYGIIRRIRWHAVRGDRGDR